MRRSTMITVLASMFVLVVAVIASAQMMNMKGNTEANNSEAVTDDTGMMDMMNNISSHCRMMSDDFANLEEHFNSMMKMNNMGKLKKEMQNHQDMMTSMHNQISENSRICSEMISMMHSRGGIHEQMMESSGTHGQIMPSGGMKGQKAGSCCPQPGTKKSASSDESSQMDDHGHNQ